MIGCGCAVCQSPAPEDKRFRASIVVQHDDGSQVLVDTTPDLRSQALAWQLTRVDAVVYTHSHADHIFGLDELRRFIALRGGGTLTVHGDAGTLAELKRIFAYAFSSPAELGGGVPRLVPSVVDGVFDVAGTRWQAVPILHGRRRINGYRIGGFAYLTDCSGVPEESWALLDGLDLLVGVDRPRAGGADVADRRGAQQLAAAGLVQLALVHPLLQDVELRLVHDPVQTQQQTVRMFGRVVHPVGVGQQHPVPAAQLKELVPVLARPG